MPAHVPDITLKIFPLHGILYDHGVVSCTCSAKTKCTRIGKHPMVRWRSYDENTKGPSGGYGIQTGTFNSIFVVDLDVKDGKEGIKNFIALGDVPDTLGVLTPSSGAHLYFRLPTDRHVPTSHGELGEGIDIQSEGGFVVGPGSPHVNGGTYQEAPGALQDAPGWLLDLVCQAKPTEPVVGAHRSVEPSSPEGVRAVEWAKDFLARAEPAVQGQGGSDRLFHAACHLMYSALPLDVLRQLVEEIYNPRCTPAWSYQEIAHKLTDADRMMSEPRGLASPGFWDRLRGVTKETGPRVADPLHEYTFEIGMRSSSEATKASFTDVAADLFEHVNWAGVLMYDTFADRIVAVDPPMQMQAETDSLSDNDVQLVRAWLEYHGKKLSVQDVRAAIEAAARRRPFHPVHDWLEALVWDETPRLDTVLSKYFEAPDGVYERSIGPRWFISMIARIMRPGCQSDCTLILEGEQHVGKTSTFRSLMRNPRWYAECAASIDSKDFYENLRGVWLVGFDELDSLTRASLTKVKTVLTATRDRYRKSYGHYTEDYPRSCGFCGTTNSSQYLNDTTGGRRFWPVKVLRPIDRQRIEQDRDQLWAEALLRFRRGDPWHVDTPELRALCSEEQEARLEIDGWEEAIVRWLNDPTKCTWAPVTQAPGSVFKGIQPFDASKGITTTDALEHAVGKLKGQWSPGDAQRVGRIFTRLKFERKQFRLNKTDREWRYVKVTS